MISFVRQSSLLKNNFRSISTCNSARKPRDGSFSLEKSSNQLNPYQKWKGNQYFIRSFSSTSSIQSNNDIWKGKLGMEARSPSTSHKSIKLDFAKNQTLRLNYMNPFGGVRIGFILEELDALAGRIAYSHALGNSSIISEVIVRPKNDEPVKKMESPITIVTASCERILLHSNLAIDKSLQMEGNVTWVGTSSMEVCIKVFQFKGEEKVEVMQSFFNMVARDKSNKSSPLPPLLLNNDEERRLFAEGEENSRRRKESSKISLDNVPPNEEERQLIHQLHIQMKKEIQKNGGNLPVQFANMKDSSFESLVLMQPQNRNIHHKIFGGYLMRKAFELAWSSTFVYSGVPPIYIALDETHFLAPIEIGDSVRFSSQISFTSGNNIIVNVVADVISPRYYSKYFSICFSMPWSGFCTPDYASIL
eukprot:TRINITY_DN2612_c0_g1_i4.p1 TRINITY_DN2612_c0_g1~~TRINITY_DN2612_c0_g1_i4.p1  ORF type:complete len:419 (-),score=133.54 TRINITY_DN2612_c0_g1_i4:1255-2511(-)